MPGTMFDDEVTISLKEVGETLKEFGLDITQNLVISVEDRPVFAADSVEEAAVFAAGVQAGAIRERCKGN